MSWTILGVLLFKHCNNEQNKVPQHEEKNG
jgi:hypothetical protein